MKYPIPEFIILTIIFVAAYVFGVIDTVRFIIAMGANISITALIFWVDR